MQVRSNPKDNGELLVFLISLNDEPHHFVLCFCYCSKTLKFDLKVAHQKVKQDLSVRKLNQLN